MIEAHYARGMGKREYMRWYRRHKDEATPRNRKFRGKLTERECLGCGKIFQSEGFHNCRCSQCRALDQKLNPVVIYAEFKP